MNLTWDYTTLADAYRKRPEYAPDALEQLFSIAELRAEDAICDIGAGVAHLTIPLARKGYFVDAIEPNAAMRSNGIQRTTQFPNVTWYEGTGENTGRPSNNYTLVSFGSSFNACDRQLALQEAWRLLKPHGYITCLWNHRDLDDPIQAAIEHIITKAIPTYSYGTRREDQSSILLRSGLFNNIQKIEARIIHNQPIEETIEAWYSHATLQRQSGTMFTSIIKKIASYLMSLKKDTIQIPYTTRAWIAQRTSVV